MVKLRKQPKAMPFPRRITGWEQQRFWKKLQEDVWNCGEIMPGVTEFYRKFSDLMYNSWEDALENYRGFKDTICRGEEYELPEKYTKTPVLGKSLEDEIVIVTSRLYSNERNCSIDPIIEEVQKVRGISPSIEIVKNSLKKGWRQHKGDIQENEDEVSHYMLVIVPKECLEKIIGEPLP